MQESEFVISLEPQTFEILQQSVVNTQQIEEKPYVNENPFDQINEVMSLLTKSINGFDRSKLTISLPEKQKIITHLDINILSIPQIEIEENGESLMCSVHSINQAPEVDIKCHVTKDENQKEVYYDNKNYLIDDTHIINYQMQNDLNQLADKVQVQNYKDDIRKLKIQLQDYKEKQVKYYQDTVQPLRKTHHHKQSTESFIPSNFLSNNIHHNILDQVQSLNASSSQAAQSILQDDPFNELLQQKAQLQQDDMDFYKQNIEKTKQQLQIFTLDSPKADKKPISMHIQQLQTQLNSIPLKQQKKTSHLKQSTSTLKSNYQQDIWLEKQQKVKLECQKLIVSSIVGTDDFSQQQIKQSLNNTTLSDQQYTQQNCNLTQSIQTINNNQTEQLNQSQAYSKDEQTQSINEVLTSSFDDYEVMSPNRKSFQQDQLLSKYTQENQCMQVSFDIKSRSDSLILTNSDIDKDVIRSKVNQSQITSKSTIEDKNSIIIEDLQPILQLQLPTQNLSDFTQHKIISDRTLQAKLQYKKQQISTLQERAEDLKRRQQLVQKRKCSKK
ncbi:hypothetical protein SS50377_22057 [Spironucleus salmonicida]|uniref:Uncharacterized protein n=1 Tax=Spironucleus salmonicida TaxID=348837 RepID=V6LPZ2_9EUKA|nr:hypothetical protein SS50377_22057 [Spironucleus salmonicida]|eukprot:EST45781.1 Hypothetical protein SS50377_14353 [Spironucleus salmonicida]